MLAALLVAARSPQRPSVAGTPPERGEPVVFDLMIKSNAPLGIFVYSIPEIKIKLNFWMPNKAKIWDSGKVRPCISAKRADSSQLPQGSLRSPWDK